MTILIDGVLANQCSVCALSSIHSIPSFPVFGVLERDQHHLLLRWLIASRASTERSCYCGAGSHRSGVFNATFLPNGSDERQWSGWIKAVGCWFESGRCVGAFSRVKFH